MDTTTGTSKTSLRSPLYKKARRGAPLLGLIALLLVSMWSGQSQARLDPYYLLRGLSVGQVKPRILFVLDTSGSMTWKSYNTSQMCDPEECEDVDAGQDRSRINTAREAIRTVISDIGGTANFAFMTFDMADPVTRNSQDPTPCETTVSNGDGGWGWVSYSDDWVWSCVQAYGIYWHYSWADSWHEHTGWHNGCKWRKGDQYEYTEPTYTVVSARFERKTRMYNGWSQYYNGADDYGGEASGGRYYRLCGDNRPYPYLRWDELGYDSSGVDNKLSAATQEETGAILASPINDVGLSGSNARTVNETRKVQFFPDFLGVRINLNDETDPDQGYLVATFGDYGNPNNGGNNNLSDDSVSSNQLNGVWEQDFYYWPYVDGFVGYSYYIDNNDRMLGHQERLGTDGATLYSPFYLEGAGALPTEDQGPASLDAAMNKALAVNANQNEGGVDARGGTPWTAAIGSIPSDANVTVDNSPYSHDTVASYLKFVTDTLTQDACVPTAALLVTDGAPNCDTCTNLYNNLAALRNDLDVSVYVVGFLTGGAKLNRMACAGAGASGDNNPCNNTPADGWDTCNNIENDGHQDSCAYVASNAAELAAQLAGIVAGIIEADLESGKGSSTLDTGVGAGGSVGQGVLVATSITANTVYPEWRGNVTRATCDTGQTYCDDQPFDELVDQEETFSANGASTCTQKRTWEAGDCLEQMNWTDRRIYFNDVNNNAKLITDTGAFRTELNAAVNEVPGAPFDVSEASAIANYIRGKDWPDDYKLAGLANSAPIVIRRVPYADSSFSPSVGIRDPHCAGRKLGGGEEVAQSLIDFSEAAWDDTLRITGGYDPHHEYQEAVVIGSDIGLVHFFQYDSGNEIVAFMPRFHLKHAVEQYNNDQTGNATMGQLTSLEEHSFGVAATANNTWVFDPDIGTDGGWRHVLIMGSGIGGEHYFALDVSHLSPASPSGPIEVLWTTQDNKTGSAWAKLQASLGESWARPAISYWADSDLISDTPRGIVTLTAGYPNGGGGSVDGRYIGILDAITGDVIDSFSVPAPSVGDSYEPTFGLVSDPAIASQCISRYWGEAQEMYLNDPSGRLFRVDLNKDMNHENTWAAVPGGADNELTPVFTFPACQSTGATCSTSVDKNEAFIFSPAVAAIDRIDELAGLSGDMNPNSNDRYLLAMASGSLYDDSTDGGDESNDFHSSLYVIADNHNASAGEPAKGGISIPNGGGRTAPGTDAGFARIVLTDLERKREFTPYPGATPLLEIRNFSKGARPTGTPLIRVTQAAQLDGQNTIIIPGVEFYYIEFSIFEPASESCDLRFKDGNTWYADEGSTYTLTMRIPVGEGESIDFANGNGTSYGQGPFSGAGLELDIVRQNIDGNCADGVCGPSAGTPTVSPCDPNTDPETSTTLSTRSVGYSELRGFNPYERL